MAPIKNVDLSSPAFKANPYPFHAQLREEAPVHRIVLGDKRPVWLVTRYEDVITVLKDDRFAKDKKSVLSPDQLAREPWIPRFLKPLEHNMLDSDAPEHSRLRALVHTAFTPRLIEKMRERIERLTDELLDVVQPRGRMDLARRSPGWRARLRSTVCCAAFRTWDWPCRASHCAGDPGWCSMA